MMTIRIILAALLCAILATAVPLASTTESGSQAPTANAEANKLQAPVSDSPVEDVDEVLNAAKQALVQADSTIFQSGTATVAPGSSVRIKAQVANPVIFLSGFQESRETALDKPAIVPRVSYDDATSQFTLTATQAPCDGQVDAESIDYFIMSGDNSQSIKAYDGVKIAVFTANVQRSKDRSDRRRVNFPVEKGGMTFSYSALCFATIQTTNQPGYMQVNTERPKHKKAKKARALQQTSTDVRIAGTYHGLVAANVEIDPSGSETVGFFCVENPGENKPVTVQGDGLDLRIEAIRTINGPPVAGLVPGSYDKVMLGGQLNGGEPYHVRTWPRTSNGMHMVYLQEDNCEHTRITHIDEILLTAAFN